jgi:hypothetical protein
MHTALQNLRKHENLSTRHVVLKEKNNYVAPEPEGDRKSVV